MRSRHFARRCAIAVLATAMVCTASLPALADDGDDDYPTWAEVEAAKHSESAKKAEAERLESALDRAQTEAADAAAQAQTAQTAAEQAQLDLAAAADRERQLAVGLEQAQQDLDANSDELGRMVSWMYTDGSGLASTSELATAQNPEEYMAKLSTISQVSGTWNQMAERAAADVNTTSTMRAQAQAAKDKRAELADAAEQAAAAAEQAQQDAAAAVDTATERSDTVYKQLASLKDTTADVERRYQVGQRVAAQAREQQRQREEEAQRQADSGGAPSTGSGSGSGSGSGADSGSGDTGSSGGPGSSGGNGGGSPSNNSPAAAQSYARGQLSAYGWGGGEYSCLVNLWNGESDWNYQASNPSSGAYGIPQSLPGEKMAAAGADWRTNARTQVDWGLAYIQSAYGSPCSAWNTWQSRWPHWY